MSRERKELNKSEKDLLMFSAGDMIPELEKSEKRSIANRTYK